jgi:hypothetical protein
MDLPKYNWQVCLEVVYVAATNSADTVQTESCLVVISPTLFLLELRPPPEEPTSSKSNKLNKSTKSSKVAPANDLHTKLAEAAAAGPSIGEAIVELVIKHLQKHGCRVRNKHILDHHFIAEHKHMERLFTGESRAAINLRPTALEDGLGLTKSEIDVFQATMGLSWASVIGSSRVFNAAGAIKMLRVNAEGLHAKWLKAEQYGDVAVLRGPGAGMGVAVARLLPDDYYQHKELEKQKHRRRELGLDAEENNDMKHSDPSGEEASVESGTESKIEPSAATDPASSPNIGSMSGTQAMRHGLNHSSGTTTKKTKKHGEDSGSDASDDEDHGGGDENDELHATGGWDDIGFVNSQAIFCVNGHMPYILQQTQSHANVQDNHISGHHANTAKEPRPSMTILAVEWDVIDDNQSHPSFHHQARANAVQSWNDFCIRVIGNPDPKLAHPQSLVAHITKDWRALGFSRAPSMFDHVLHCSASAFQAMVDRLQLLPGHSLFTDSIARSLMKLRISTSDIQLWSKNPTVSITAKVPRATAAVLVNKDVTVPQPLFGQLRGLGSRDCLTLLTLLTPDSYSCKI